MMITVSEARKRKVCRICEDPAYPRKLSNGDYDAFITMYSTEYAHQSCRTKELLNQKANKCPI